MTTILPGIDTLAAGRHDDIAQWLRTKRVGLVTNHTGQTRNGTPTLEVLRVLNISVAALFSPEHGPRGTEEGDIASEQTSDGMPIYSLYGETRRPTPEMLRDIDALVFDIQDVGARFYTYSTTLAFCLEECAAHGVSLLVLDRPNPLGGERIEGPIVEDDCRSFIGHVRLPVIHGMTLGEMALLHRADQNLEVDVRIVPVEGWNRAQRWPETNLEWIAPSPNLPDYNSAAWYPALCLLEFSGVSVGRGTEAPFQIVGAPWLNAQRVLQETQNWPRALQESVSLEAIEFTPTRATHEGEECRGLRLRSQNIEEVPLVALGLALLVALHRAHPQEMNEEKLHRAAILIGSNRVLNFLKANDLESALQIVNEGAQSFRARRREFLLYE